MRLEHRQVLPTGLRWVRQITGSDWTPAILALICGVALSIGSFSITRQYYRDTQERSFALATAHQAEALQEGLRRYTDAVSAVATFVTASDHIDRWEFLRFADVTLGRYTGFSALAWVPRIPQQEREEYEAGVQRDGLFGLTIRQTNESGTLVPALDRLEYLPIAYLVPFAGNEDALSYDLGSEGRYRHALDTAADLGTLQATEPLDLPRTASNGTAVWLVLPLYARNSAPTDVVERRRALIGFAIGVLRLDFFVADILGPEFQKQDLFILDATSGSVVDLLGKPTATSTAYPEHLLTITKQLEVAGRRWSLVAMQESGRGWTIGDLLPWCVALLTGLLTGLLAQHLINSVLQRRKIELVVGQRTAELSDRNSQLRFEIAQRQQTEIDLRAAKDQADSANQAKSEFLAMVSHELRTPLNAIIGFSALLSGETHVHMNPAKSREYATDIHQSGTHLLSLINDILDLSKAEVGKVDLKYELINVQNVIAGCLAMIRPRAEASFIDLIAKPMNDLPLLHADERKLSQILLNLLSNAVKFTPENGTVSVGATVTAKGELAIVVQDTGIGIAKAEIERVFEPFVQLDSSLARKYEGTGLGLALSRRWVHLLGGTLILDSELGKGTVAQIRFPKDRLGTSEPKSTKEGESRPGRSHGSMGASTGR